VESAYPKRPLLPWFGVVQSCAQREHGVLMKSPRYRRRHSEMRPSTPQAKSMLRAKEEGERIAHLLSEWGRLNQDGAGFLAHSVTALLELSDTLVSKGVRNRKSTDGERSVLLQDCLAVVDDSGFRETSTWLVLDQMRVSLRETPQRKVAARTRHRDPFDDCILAARALRKARSASRAARLYLLAVADVAFCVGCLIASWHPSSPRGDRRKTERR
jgi:hypothetical protein